jgi:hypothetical protein
MSATLINMFLSGMITTGSLVAGLFFVRFWSRSRDSLFLAFAAAFWLLALNQLLVSLVDDETEARHIWLYLLRVAAFLLIAIAIVRKNVHDADDRTHQSDKQQTTQ